MEHNEVIALDSRDLELSGPDNSIQVHTPLGADEFASSLTKNPALFTSQHDCINSTGPINYTNDHLTTTTAQYPFPTPVITSITKADASEDARLLEAAKDGLTDIILHLIEEEGQQLHNHKDKVLKISNQKCKVKFWQFKKPWHRYVYVRENFLSFQ